MQAETVAFCILRCSIMRGPQKIKLRAQDIIQVENRNQLRGLYPQTWAESTPLRYDILRQPYVRICQKFPNKLRGRRE